MDLTDRAIKGFYCTYLGKENPACLLLVTITNLLITQQYKVPGASFTNMDQL